MAQLEGKVYFGNLTPGYNWERGGSPIYAHAYSGCSINEKRSNVQIFIFCPFLPMPILAVLLIFGEVTARMGTNRAATHFKTSN